MTDIGAVTLSSTHGTALDEEDTGDNGLMDFVTGRLSTPEPPPPKKRNRFSSLKAELTTA